MKDRWLIAVDLDGTLFHTDHQISSRTLNTMHGVVELGHLMVIVTGRSLHTAVSRLKAIPAGTRLLCSNGAYEYDREKQQVAWANKLSAPNAIEIRRKILSRLPNTSFGWETEGGLSFENKFIDEAGGAHTLEQGGSYEQLGYADLFKLYVRTPELLGGALAKVLQDLFGPEYEISSSGAPFVEITAAGVNKGSALEVVAAELGIKSRRTIAFGDNLNDISMLQWAGESVAMGNATSELQAIASARAHSNAEDGVAQYLEAKFMGF